MALMGADLLYLQDRFQDQRWKDLELVAYYVNEALENVGAIKADTGISQGDAFNLRMTAFQVPLLLRLVV